MRPMPPMQKSLSRTVKQFRVKHKWKDEWLAVGTSKLRSLKSSIDVWPSICDRDPKISCILTRLRIWHTRLTDQHLMENRPPLYCTDCLVPLTVRHFLAVRRWLFPRTIGEDVDQTLQTMLSENLGDFWSSLAYAISAGNWNDWYSILRWFCYLMCSKYLVYNAI